MDDADGNDTDDPGPGRSPGQRRPEVPEENGVCLAAVARIAKGCVNKVACWAMVVMGFIGCLGGGGLP